MRSVLFFLLWVLLTATAVAQGLSKQIALQDSSLHLVPINTFTTTALQEGASKQIVPQNYYAKHLGFFCRQELKMQQAKVPVSFRIGSMDQCNTLEQKPGYR